MQPLAEAEPKYDDKILSLTVWLEKLARKVTSYEVKCFNPVRLVCASFVHTFTEFFRFFLDFFPIMERNYELLQVRMENVIKTAILKLK